MFHVYIIRSIYDPSQIYIGRTSDLKKRLADHNSGWTKHTSKYKPWKLIAVFNFEELMQSVEFEKHLKSGSGRAFIAKRLS